MLSFAPTEEQEEIRHLARSIAVDHLRAQGRSAERSGDLSPALTQTLAQTGLTTPFPEKYGGSGSIEAMAYALIAEELGFGDGGLAMNIIGSLMGPVAVALAGNEQQCETHISPFGYGNSAERGCLAFAERTGGYTLSEISTTFRRDGQHVILCGTKRDVIHGEQASLRVLLARQEGGEDIYAFVLPHGAEGLKTVPETHKLGLLATPSASYTLDDVRIPADAMLASTTGAVRAATLYAIL
ncbi:MAG: acyl-CoA dehydrogenase family protein, partial [Ktedonobacteraceae bacterium]|nr:acyl-CoA dehydrogenase family protein [Ktedonobacteraceae bacterium]